MNLHPGRIKSGTSGKMQSMHVFLNEKKLKTSICCSLEKFNHYDKIEKLFENDKI